MESILEAIVELKRKNLIMPQCNLIIDSCCDLPPELVQQEGIYLLKFPYILNDDSYDDDLFQSTSAHEFYEGMRKGAEPSTAQVSIPTFEKIFTEVVETGRPSVYLSFTSGLSGSFDSAEIVRDQVLEAHPGAELYVVDTLLASVAEGILVYEAIRQWNKGLSAADLAKWAEEARYYIDCAFMVDDLKSLHRGGRIPASVAAIGSVLDAKPLLTIDIEGKLTMTGIARGRKKGIKQLADYFAKHHVDQEGFEVVVTGNSDCPRDAQRLAEMIQSDDDKMMIIEGTVGPVIGSHVGPGMVALAFWGQDQRENKSMSMSDRIARKVTGS